MTNQTHIISVVGPSTLNTTINHFISLSIPQGYINFDIKPPVVTPEYSGGAFTGRNWYTVMVNYYDPSIM